MLCWYATARPPTWLLLLVRQLSNKWSANTLISAWAAWLRRLGRLCMIVVLYACSKLKALVCTCRNTCTLHTIPRRYAAGCCKDSNVNRKGNCGILDILRAVLSEIVDEVVLGYNSYVSYQYADSWCDGRHYLVDQTHLAKWGYHVRQCADLTRNCC